MDYINKILVGDCRKVLKKLPPDSIASVVTDPPYELGFMGKGWDSTGIAYYVGMWREVLRVLKPGGHLASFGGTRTYHRMACAIEDAGFEIRDQLQWLYGSGFPKSLDVSKAIDKAACAKREIIGSKDSLPGYSRKPDKGRGVYSPEGRNSDVECDITAPATDAAKKWSGWGTALKPANEPICLARKPISEKTVAANVLKWGTGALNIDACRIDGAYKWRASDSDKTSGASFKGGSFGEGPNEKGRWPANVLFDEEAAKQIDEQSGGLVSGANPTSRSSDKFRNDYGEFKGQRECVQHRGLDSGGASRFFYCAKTSREERNIGLAGDPGQTKAEVTGQKEGSAGLKHPRASGTSGGGNFHPTVKPVDLMKWLIKLITPPGGVVVDPFAGSGSTLLACAFLNVPWVGIELSEEYAAIARKRIKNEMDQGKLF